MKMKTSALIIVLGLSTSLAHADDLESIFDEAAATAPAKGSKPVAAKAEKDSPLISAMRKAIGVTNSEQNIFLRYFANEEWQKAALQFPAAFEGTEFQKSANGRALFGLVQFRAGLPITGLQTLFLATQPAQIHELLQSEWREALPVDHFAWKTVNVNWKPEWEQVFDKEHGVRVKVTETLAKADVSSEVLEKLSAETPDNSAMKADVDWRLALSYAMKDQGDLAAKVLARLMKNPQAAVSKDLMQITAARMLFQNGYFDASIKYYEKVAKKSDYWTEAQEEMGWAYLRKGEPNNAKAISQSLIHPALEYQTSSESFFIHALAQLKVCDYKGVMDTLQTFPKRFKERTKNLEALSVRAENPEVNRMIALLKAKRIHLQDVGSLGQSLPRGSYHDERLFQLAQNQKHLEEEAAAAEKLYAQSLALTGLQGTFENIKQASLNQAQSAKNASLDRVKDLAKTEVEATKEILRKLHIVEAEVLQQVSIADKIVKNLDGTKSEEKKGVTGYKGAGEIARFPAEKEVWFDELSNYRVDVKKACTVKR